jgi:hypothetical protein
MPARIAEGGVQEIKGRSNGSDEDKNKALVGAHAQPRVCLFCTDHNVVIDCKQRNAAPLLPKIRPAARLAHAATSALARAIARLPPGVAAMPPERALATHES